MKINVCPKQNLEVSKNLIGLDKITMHFRSTLTMEFLKNKFNTWNYKVYLFMKIYILLHYFTTDEGKIMSTLVLDQWRN